MYYSLLFAKAFAKQGKACPWACQHCTAQMHYFAQPFLRRIPRGTQVKPGQPLPQGRCVRGLFDRAQPLGSLGIRRFITNKVRGQRQHPYQNFYTLLR